MKDFKFFRGYSGTLNVMDSQTYATASLYYPNTLRVEVNPNPLSNNEMERWYAQHVRRDEQITNNQIRLFQTTTVTTVNPNWRTKIKMGLQEMSIFFKSSPYGIMFLWASSTIVVILILSKLFNIW